MRLPDDMDEGEGLGPSVISTIIAVTIFVLVILGIVLAMNSKNFLSKGTPNKGKTPSNSVSKVEDDFPDTDSLIGDKELTPDSFDFWEMYPEETITPEVEESKESEKKEEDPSADGKHTLVINDKGEEEWVLINQSLPKNNFDSTKLVQQDQVMKYYDNGKLTSFVGVDISKSQDYIDFVKVKKAGIDFCMIRVGARGYESGKLVLDEYFTDNIKRATDAGLKVGVYFFSQAITTAEAIEEANMVLQNVKGYNLAYPVAFDMEYIDNDTSRVETLTKSEKTDITKAFLDTIKAAGYKAMIYGEKEWLIKKIDLSKLTGYDVWLSQIGDKPDYPYAFSMWQYSNNGSVDGIPKNVNLNVSFIDFSEK